jgi:response regulator RpfG family c-di-GMP phosphodiesterase
MKDLPKILIVDDLPANLIALRKLLSVHKAEIIEAQSGNEALTLCLDHEFALALLDVNMPGMDGYELAAFIHDEPKTAEIPIIFVTAAYKDDSHRIRGYGVGAVDYIEKPIDDRILNSKVRIFIDLYRKKQELAAALEEMRDTQSQLTARTDELARSNAELEQFAYVASHDLRQPLRMVSSYLALIERKLGSELDQDTKDFLGFAVDGAKQMDALILGLLEFSRVGRSSRLQWSPLAKPWTPLFIPFPTRLKKPVRK